MTAGAAIVLGALLACAGACTPRSTPTPAKESAPVPTAETSAAPAVSADGGTGTTATPPPSLERGPLPTLHLERFAPGGSKPEGVYAVEGGLVVVENRPNEDLAAAGFSAHPRVGRIEGDAVAWIDAALPITSAGGGRPHVVSVQGRWRDRLDVLYYHVNRRVPAPTYFPLTGKGRSLTVGATINSGDVYLALLGESTLAATWHSFDTAALTTVRGPKVDRRLPTREQLGCKEEEADDLPSPLRPHAFAASPDGTLLMYGARCTQRGAALALAWDRTPAPRVVEVPPQAYVAMDAATILPGRGDELFLFTAADRPVLRYAGGRLEPLPRLERPFRHVFVSAAGALHASDGDTVHRLDGGRWVAVARLAWPSHFDAMAVEGDALWAAAGGEVHRLRPGPAMALADRASTGAGAGDACPTPFVFLYDVSDKNDAKYTFPTTRAALSTFPAVSELELVEVREEGARRLGVVVRSEAQGEAVIGHLATALKNEAPRLVCYAPKEPRHIALAAGTGAAAPRP